MTGACEHRPTQVRPFVVAQAVPATAVCGDCGRLLLWRPAADPQPHEPLGGWVAAEHALTPEQCRLVEYVGELAGDRGMTRAAVLADLRAGHYRPPASAGQAELAARWGLTPVQVGEIAAVLAHYDPDWSGGDEW